MLGCCVLDIWGMTWKTTATLLLLVPVLQAPLARYAWIYRSILESVALMLKNNYDNMRNEMNHFAKHVIITGGGSNSDLFMQILPTCSTFRHDVTPLTVVQVWGSD